MRIKAWYRENTDSIIGFCIIWILVSMSVAFVLKGIYTENSFDKGLLIFIGVAIAILIIVLLLVSLKRKVKAPGGKG